MDSPTPHLNPHEAPPQALKDIFKKWKVSAKDHCEDLDNIPNNRQLLGMVSRDRLARAFKDFEEPSNLSMVQVPVYSSVDIPGNKF